MFFIFIWLYIQTQIPRNIFKVHIYRMTDHFNSCDKSFKEALINFLLEQSLMSYIKGYMLIFCQVEPNSARYFPVTLYWGLLNFSKAS